MISIHLDTTHPEGAAKFQELKNTLDAAQVPNTPSEKGDDAVLTVPDEYEKQLNNATLALGIETMDYEDDNDDYDSDSEGLYRTEATQGMFKDDFEKKFPKLYKQLADADSSKWSLLRFVAEIGLDDKSKPWPTSTSLAKKYKLPKAEMAKVLKWSLAWSKRLGYVEQLSYRTEANFTGKASDKDGKESADSLIDKVVNGQSVQDTVDELIVPYYFSGKKKKPPKKEKKKAASNSDSNKTSSKPGEPGNGPMSQTEAKLTVDEVKLAKNPTPKSSDMAKLKSFLKSYKIKAKRMTPVSLPGVQGPIEVLPSWSFTDEMDSEEFETFAVEELGLYANSVKVKGKWVVSVGRKA